MRRAPRALTPSSSDDSLDDMNDAFHEGNWLVVRLGSLESVPFSEYSHTPYGEASSYLFSHAETFSMASNQRLQPVGSSSRWRNTAHSVVEVSSGPSVVQQPATASPVSKSTTALQTLLQLEIGKHAQPVCGPPSRTSTDFYEQWLSPRLPVIAVQNNPHKIIPVRSRRRVPTHGVSNSADQSRAAATEGPMDEPVHAVEGDVRLVAPVTQGSSVERTVPVGSRRRHIGGRRNSRSQNKRILCVAVVSQQEVEQAREGLRVVESVLRSPPDITGDEVEPSFALYQRAISASSNGRSPTQHDPPSSTSVLTNSKGKRRVSLPPLEQALQRAMSADTSLTRSPRAKRHGSFLVGADTPSLLGKERRTSTSGAIVTSPSVPVASRTPDLSAQLYACSDECVDEEVQRGDINNGREGGALFFDAVAPNDTLLNAIKTVSDVDLLQALQRCFLSKSGKRFADAAALCDQLLSMKVLKEQESHTTDLPNAAWPFPQNECPADILTEEDGEDEFGDDDVYLRPYPFPSSPFLYAEPTAVGTVSRVLPDGLLYRIVDESGDVHFYNDSLYYAVMVRSECTVTEGVRINPRAIQSPVEGDAAATEVTVAVLPEETNFFVSGLGKPPKVRAMAIGAPEGFVPASVTRCSARVHEQISVVRSALGQWRRATDQRSYLKCCLESKLSFTDLSFRPSATSLYRPEVDEHMLPALPWRRPSEYLVLTELGEARLFRGIISCYQVRQGCLNDWTVVSAIATLGQYPEHVKWLFRHPQNLTHGKAERAVGAYRVTLLHNGWWTTSLIDDYLPATLHGPLFAHSLNDPRRLWVSLLEKAYAKSLGSYATLCTISLTEVLYDLTGFPVRCVDSIWTAAQHQPRHSTSHKLFRYVERCVKQGYAIVVYSPDGQSGQSVGLPGGGDPAMCSMHACFICDAVHFKDVDIRFVKIRDPLGVQPEKQCPAVSPPLFGACGSWPLTQWTKEGIECDASSTAACAVQSSLPHPALPEARQEPNESTGTRWMEWSEALASYAGGCVCYTAWKWRDYRFQNRFVHGHPQYALEVTAHTNVSGIMTMSQISIRDAPHEEERAGDTSGRWIGDTLCSVAIVATKHACSSNTETVVARVCDDIECLGGVGSFVKKRDVSMKVRFDPSTSPSYVIPLLDAHDPATLGHGRDGEVRFVLSFLSDTPACLGDLVIRFKAIGKECKVFEGYQNFSIGKFRSVKAKYQCRCPWGLHTGEGRTVLDEPLLREQEG